MRVSLRTLLLSVTILCVALCIAGNSYRIAAKDRLELANLEQLVLSLGGRFDTFRTQRKWRFGIPGKRQPLRGNVSFVKTKGQGLACTTSQDRERLLNLLRSPDVESVGFHKCDVSIETLFSSGDFPNLTGFHLADDGPLSPKSRWIESFPSLTKLTVDAPALTDDEWCEYIATHSKVIDLYIVNPGFSLAGWSHIASMPLDRLEFHFTRFPPKWKIEFSGEFTKTIKDLTCFCDDEVELRKIANLKSLRRGRFSVPEGIDPSIEDEVRKALPNSDIVFY